MFGALLRAAGGFAGAMLMATLIAGTVGPLNDMIGSAIGTDATLYVAFDTFITWFPFFAALGIVAALVARGIVESSLPSR